MDAPSYLPFNESWTLTAKLERVISALEMRSYQGLFTNISYENYVTNEDFFTGSGMRLGSVAISLP